MPSLKKYVVLCGVLVAAGAILFISLNKSQAVNPNDAAKQLALMDPGSLHEAVQHSPEATIFFAPDNKKGWVVFGNATYTTNDAGASWKKLAVTSRELQYDEKKQLWAMDRQKNEVSYELVKAGGSSDWQSAPLVWNEKYEVDSPKVLAELPILLHDDNSSNAWSLDQGKTWSSQPKAVTNGLVKFEKRGNTINVVSDSGRNYVSEDDGETWSASGCQDQRCPAYRTLYTTPTKSYAWDENELLTSTDGGKTWQSVKPADYPTDVNTLWFVNDKTGFLGSDNGFFSTTDGGRHWKFEKSIPYRIYRIVPVDNQQAWALGGTKVFRTVDGGKTWNPANLPKEIDGQKTLVDIKFAGKAAWLAGEGVVLKSLDQGATWQIVWQYDGEFAPPVMEKIFINKDPRQVWMVGKSEGVLRTSDDGATWEKIDMTDDRLLTDVFASDDNQTVYIVGDYNSFYKSTDGGKHWKLRQLSDHFDFDGKRLTSDGRLFDDKEFASQIPTTGNINAVSQSFDKKAMLAVGDEGNAFVLNATSDKWKKLEGMANSTLIASYLSQDGTQMWIVSQDGNVYRSMDSGNSFKAQHL
jgi:photosystem II stability/assembly factor-like uncharacterized protein